MTATWLLTTEHEPEPGPGQGGSGSARGGAVPCAPHPSSPRICAAWDTRRFPAGSGCWEGAGEEAPPCPRARRLSACRDGARGCSPSRRSLGGAGGAGSGQNPTPEPAAKLQAGGRREFEHKRAPRGRVPSALSQSAAGGGRGRRVRPGCEWGAAAEARAGARAGALSPQRRARAVAAAAAPQRLPTPQRALRALRSGRGAVRAACRAFLPVDNFSSASARLPPPTRSSRPSRGPGRRPSAPRRCAFPPRGGRPARRAPCPSVRPSVPRRRPGAAAPRHGPGRPALGGS
jgi:hypothetical protein